MKREYKKKIVIITILVSFLCLFSGYMFEYLYKKSVNKEFQMSLKQIIISDFSPFIYRGSVTRNNYSNYDYQTDSSLMYLLSIGKSYLTTPIEVHKYIILGDNRYLRCWSFFKFKEVWSFETKARISGTPAAWNNCVIASNEAGEVICIKIEGGNIVWKIELPRPTYGSPLVYDDKIIIGSWDKNVYCLNAKNGEIIWIFRTNAPINSSASIKGDNVFICSDKIYCININSGKEVWKIEGKGSNICATPVIVGNFLICGRNTKSTVCADCKSGKVYWEALIGDNFASVATSKDIIVGSNRLGELFALSYYGEIIWKIKLTEKTSCSPLISGNKVYVGDDAGFVYIVDLYSGRVLINKHFSSGEIETPTLLSIGVSFPTTNGNLIEGKFPRYDIEKD